MYGKTSDGLGLPVLVDKFGRVIMSNDVAQAAIAGRLFSAANQTPVATSTTLNTTFTGLGIANPTASGKLLVMRYFGYALDQACAGELVLALGITTNSGFAANITPQCARAGYSTSVAIADDGATIVAPTLVQIIASLGQGADSTQFMPPPTRIDLKGSIVVPPGYAVVTDTTVATGATSIQFSFTWEEIDV